MQDNPNTTPQPAMDWLKGGGEMGARIRAFDWSQTPLGRIEQWPEALVSTLGICLSARFPMAIYWERAGFLLYNDAWRPILGDKHPWALGQSAQAVWPEIWDAIAPLLSSVWETGEATWRSDELLLMQRFGYTEECYFNYTFNPIRGRSGGVEGILNVVLETTERVIGERQLKTLRDLGERSLAEAKTVTQASHAAATALADNPYDFPFALLYLLDEDGRRARLSEAVRLTANAPAAPLEVEVGSATDRWHFDAVLATNKTQAIENLTARFGRLPAGAWTDDCTERAVVVPLARTGGQELPAGFLVAGASPRLAFDDDYRSFLELAAGHIATAIANARAYEDERRRAEALAELDRAKTAFFSNVSHEFRTPLTLLLGPLEDALHDADLPAATRAQLSIAHRNSQRLLKLVNTLLDFSRLEAGRAQASYEPTDLATFTAELVSVFRSAIERAGLTLIVDCPPLDEPVYVDREMWEKIVSNLLSNAFKFTFAGAIEVRVSRVVGGRWSVFGEEQAAPESNHSLLAADHRPPTTDHQVVLTVRDTGTGIPAEELPHLFERFHRVKGARGRSYEGSGIGLALVQELVRLHGGTIQVESEPDKGSTFTVAIPCGVAHLPAERIGGARTLASTGLPGKAYAEEALRWLPEEGDRWPVNGDQWSQPEPDATLTTDHGQRTDKARILLAEDNADMREYVQRLLRQAYEVETVTDGEAALAAARLHPPDLILTDVMMPRQDGFSLLAALRADENLQTTPVILLSARAGEESRVEGLQAGADDYLVKPFSARELLARVAAHLKLRQMRREADAARAESQAILASIRDAFFAFDRDWRYTYINERGLELTGRRHAEFLGRTLWEVFPDLLGTPFETQLRGVMENRRAALFETYYAPWQRWLEHRVYPATQGLSLFTTDITARKRREQYQSLLAEITEELVELESIQETMERLGEKIGRYFGVQHCVFAEVESFETALIVYGWNADDVPSLKGTYAVRDFLSAEQIVASKAGQLTVVNDTQTDPRVSATAYGALNIHSFILVPLVRGGAWQFLLSIIDQAPREWSADEIDQLREITTRIWTRLERARAEAAVRKSEEQFRALVTASSDVIYRMNADWTEMRSLAGKHFIPDTDQPSSTWLETYIHPDDQPQVLAVINEAIRTRSVFALEHRVIRVDGTLGWTFSRAVPLLNEQGEIREWFGTASDITERKQAAEKLRESEIRLRTLLENLPGSAAFVLDRDLRYVLAEGEALQNAGLTPQDLTGKTIFEALDASLAAQYEPLYRQALHGESFSHEHEAHGCSFVSRGVPLRHDSGEIYAVLAVSYDITERKRAEREILNLNRELERRLAEQKTLLELLPIGVCIAQDTQLDYVYANRYLSELMRLPADNISAQNAELTRTVGWRFFRDGQEITAAELPMQQAIKSGQPVTGFEFDLTLPDQTAPLSFVANVAPLFDEAGAVRGAIGGFLDISERKRMQQSLAQIATSLTRERVRLNLALRTGGFGVYEWRVRDDVLWWSPELYSLFGVEPDSFTPSVATFDALIYPEDRAELWRRTDESITQRGVFEHEYRIVRPDGTVRWIYNRSHIDFDADNKAERITGVAADITARKRAEEALRTSEQRYRALVEAASQVVWVMDAQDSRDTHRHWFSQLTGNALAAGKDQDYLAFIHPDDRDYLQQVAQGVLKKPMPYEVEFRLQPAGEDYHYYNLRGVPLFDTNGVLREWIGTVKDITETKLAQQALRASEERLRLALDSAQIGIYVWQITTNTVLWDERLRELWGLAPEDEVSYEVFFQGLHPDDRARTQAAVDQALAPQGDGRYFAEYRVIGKRDQRLRWVLATGQVYFANGAPVRLIGTAHDITARKCLEAERERLLAEEQQARETAEAATRAKDEFVAVVSHELRSPLNAILGYARILRLQRHDDVEIGKITEVIERNGRAQLQLIEDLLDTARIVSGKLKLELAPLELTEVVAAALDTLRPAAESKRITLEVAFESVRQPHVYQLMGDAARLQQVVWNLLSNALKFTPEGGRVQVALSCSDTAVRIAVSDTGKGIEAALLPYIFDRFKQGDSSSTRRFGGLGLGLALVKHLVELHGGQIEVQSAGAGQGATFTVTLPRQPAETTERLDVFASAPPVKRATFPSACLQGVRVLVVDDEEEARELVAHILRAYGAFVATAESAATGFALLETAAPSLSFDLLVSDIGMPYEDGYQLLQRVRGHADEGMRNLPAIALTAYARAEDRLRALQSGFQMHVPKPVEEEELLMVAASLTGRLHAGKNPGSVMNR